jgi:hypothetical protein
MSDIFYQHTGWRHLTSKELTLPEWVFFYSTNPKLSVRYVDYRAASPPPDNLCATELEAIDRLLELLKQHIEHLQSRLESLMHVEGDDAIGEGYKLTRTIRMAVDLQVGLQKRRETLRAQETDRSQNS